MNKQIKERGIIFNGEMVRAILSGRKTQTRRIITPQPELTVGSGFSWKGAIFGAGSDDRETNRNFAHVRCPFGKVGDRLWVRETFTFGMCTESTLAYRATHKPSDLQEGWYETIKWRPSIHMPRWASRITLEITDIRVERLQDISTRDALAEGLHQLPASGRYCLAPGMQYFGEVSHSSKEVYSWLWESIYGQDSWQSNPFVWVVEFKRVEAS
ncbi:hypothetical protein HH682_11950 [Rosenbergiella sp. S61]|uniref:Morphogenetic protein n=1 Tax=Rosenbergiella gaditana TaxID=2726987 RepID=A0ABS5SYI9_9GAMM|nr:hypothetical protein [Rosenbergiella gaditana]MBT0725114.1 hypothetical protein [Rosenbergiella gaditana]